MSFELRVGRNIGKEVRRVANRRLTMALEELAVLDQGDPVVIERSVHEVRKRCKEVRALARLVKSSIGGEFDAFDRQVHSASDALSAARDAQAVLQTFGHLRDMNAGAVRADLDAVHAVLRRDADRAAADIGGNDQSLREAVALLEAARAGAAKWKLPNTADTVLAGIERTYDRGRNSMRRADQRPTDARFHEWRKAVKHLWYGIRLLENAAPMVLTPLADVLDDLAEALGDDHDLAVLVQILESDTARFGGTGPVHVAVALAREQQAALRIRASRLGATVYAERPKAFRRRVEAYWELGSHDWPAVAADSRVALLDPSTVELERKFLVDSPPDGLTNGTNVRQGYLARDGSVSVRLREATSGDRARVDYTLTVKGGQGTVRTEIECQIAPSQFEAAWPYTGRRRVRKTRYRIPFDDHTIELDVFHDDLDGLLLAEVEFGSEAEMASFEPPDWFGRDVSDDVAYSNSSLATNPRPHCDS